MGADSLCEGPRVRTDPLTRGKDENAYRITGTGQGARLSWRLRGELLLLAVFALTLSATEKWDEVRRRLRVTVGSRLHASPQS